MDEGARGVGGAGGDCADLREGKTLVSEVGSVVACGFAEQGAQYGDRIPLDMDCIRILVTQRHPRKHIARSPK